jgi:RNA-binding protein
MPVLDITSQTRSALRAAAHPLKPVVLMGDKGLTDAVLQEIDRNLSVHGLIKVRAAGKDRDERDEMLTAICDATSCAPVHHLGKIFILYRPTEDDPQGKGLLAGRPAPVDPDFKGARQANEAHIPKKLAAVGKAAPERKRADRVERPAGPVTARERYLGPASGKASRPSTGETGSRRGEARKLADRFSTTRSPAERRAAEARSAERTARGGERGNEGGAAPARTPRRSALSLRAGARGAGPARSAPRVSGAPRKARTSTKK